MASRQPCTGGGMGATGEEGLRPHVKPAACRGTRSEGLLGDGGSPPPPAHPPIHLGRPAHITDISGVLHHIAHTAHLPLPTPPHPSPTHPFTWGAQRTSLTSDECCSTAHSSPAAMSHTHLEGGGGVGGLVRAGLGEEWGG